MPWSALPSHVTNRYCSLSSPLTLKSCPQHCRALLPFAISGSQGIEQLSQAFGLPRPLELRNPRSVHTPFTAVRFPRAIQGVQCIVDFTLSVFHHYTCAGISYEIARQIEDQLEYPGQVKVTVIRESRAVEVAK